MMENEVIHVQYSLCNVQLESKEKKRPFMSEKMSRTIRK